MAVALALNRVFAIQKRQSTIACELLGGVTCFLGSAGNLVATASVLKVGGLPFVDGVVGGAWAGFAGNLLVGLLGDLPITVSAGSGPNLTVAYLMAQSVSEGGLGSYGAAVTCCMVSGLVIAVLTALGATSIITKIVPPSLKQAICVGIGLLCAFVGFQQVDLVVKSEQGLIGPGDIQHSPEIWLSIGGLLFLTLLNSRQVKGAMLWCIVLVTLVDWTFVSGWPKLHMDPIKLPQVYWPEVGVMTTANFWSQVCAMVLMLVFDAMGCIFGLARLSGRLDQATGDVEGGNGAFCAIGLGSLAAGFWGLSPLVVSSASAAGIADGARTGLSTCVTGVLFLLACGLSSILAAMPPCASSIILIYSGVSFAADAANIPWDDPITAVSAFLCIICQPFLFSIASGIYMGLAASLILNLCSGRLFANWNRMRADQPEKSEISLHTPVEFVQRLSQHSPEDRPRRAHFLYEGIQDDFDKHHEVPLLQVA